MLDIKKVGQAIAKRRISIGMTQEDLAGASEIDRSYISGIENGKRRVSLETFFKIAEALETTSWSLLEDASKNNH